MVAFLSHLAIWGHGLAACLFAAFAIWQFQRNGFANRTNAILVGAAAATALWALAVAVEGIDSPISNFTETLRNFAWLGFMFQLLRTADGAEKPTSIKIIYAILALLLMGQLIVDALLPVFAGSPRLIEMTAYTALLCRMIFAVAALVLVHNLYSVAAPEGRWHIRLPMASLAAIWTYDLNLFTIAYLANSEPTELLAMRGLAVACTAPVLALAAMRTDAFQIKLSRSVAFRSLSLVAIASYLLLMIVVATVIQIVGGDYARLAQISFVFATTIAALLLLPSSRFQAWLKVKVTKNFFQHRYDYRSEWLRFTDTIGRPSANSGPIHERVIKALADITDSPGGLLLMPDESGCLAGQARWNWPTARVPTRACTASTVSFFEDSGHIVEFDALRSGDDEQTNASAIPEWMLNEPLAWAAVPLVHFNRLAGVIILTRPRINRRLDWEDLDLLRIVGRQVASYLAEQRSQEALSEAQRFDEFNRRMAFIMHDLKNLVSQLALIAKNAERHADNPEFRADMVSTLQDSVKKMNALLARLAQHNKAKPEEPKPVRIGELVQSIIQSKKLLHAIESNQIEDLTAVADPVRVDQILGHLIQNAVDASPDGQPIFINVRRRDLSAAIEIVDHGHGMSSEFVRNNLFKPFSSSKEGGFGIGAYEARALAIAMNGRLEVDSKEGRGSRFTLVLPLAQNLIEYDEPVERVA
ncbi:MAG: XrtA/PEP-CTERM system histidine kinase PrsK [Parasphingorhabdus sp.]|nr:XrtA/PEP-CTERM system histidine kinase PrsK [Parasphingorhabdus sp.]